MTDNEQKPDLPDGWLWVRVEDLGEVVTGRTPKTSVPEYHGNEYPFYKPTDLNRGYYTKTASVGLTESGIEQARLLPVGSTLVTCIGATIGKTGFIRTEGASNQQINAVIPAEALVPEYVYFTFISPELQKSILSNASSTTLPILNKGKFKSLSFPLAPVNEQHRIVEKIEELFSDLDAGVAALRQVRQQLQRYRQAVLKAAVEGKLTEAWRQQHGHEAEPADVLLERILAERRRTWEAEQLATYEAKGKTPPKNWQQRYKEPAAPEAGDLPDLPEGWVWITMDLDF